MHAKRLMVTFDESDELAQDQEIETVAQVNRLLNMKCGVTRAFVRLTQSITALFRKCEATLKRHGVESERSGTSRKT